MSRTLLQGKCPMFRLLLYGNLSCGMGYLKQRVRLHVKTRCCKSFPASCINSQYLGMEYSTTCSLLTDQYMECCGVKKLLGGLCPLGSFSGANKQPGGADEQHHAGLQKTSNEARDRSWVKNRSSCECSLGSHDISHTSSQQQPEGLW